MWCNFSAEDTPWCIEQNNSTSTTGGVPASKMQQQLRTVEDLHRWRPFSITYVSWHTRHLLNSTHEMFKTASVIKSKQQQQILLKFVQNKEISIIKDCLLQSLY